MSDFVSLIIDPHFCDAVQPRPWSLKWQKRWVHSSGPAYGLLESDLGPVGLHLTEEDSAF